MKPDELSPAELAAFFARQEPAGPPRIPQPPQFTPLAPGSSGPGEPQEANLGLLMDVELQVTVELGRTRRRVREILALAAGSVVELDRLAGEAVDILVNGRLVARGEVVVIGENFGVRIGEILAPAYPAAGR